MSGEVTRLRAEVDRHDPDKRPDSNADIRVALDLLRDVVAALREHHPEPKVVSHKGCTTCAVLARAEEAGL